MATRKQGRAPFLTFEFKDWKDKEGNRGSPSCQKMRASLGLLETGKKKNTVGTLPDKGNQKH